MLNYDQLYKENVDVWGTKPSPNLHLILDKLTKGADFLDLGCGQGRDSIFMAKHGFNVLAVDKSEVVIAGLRQSAKQNNLSNLHCLALDVVDFDFSRDRYDAINIVNVLRYLQKDNAEKILLAAKNNLKGKGLILITAFSEQDASYKPGLGYFSLIELKSIFADFYVIFEAEKPLKDPGHAGDEKPHQHWVSFLVAQKP